MRPSALLLGLLTAFAPVQQVAAERGPVALSVEVPFLPQTEALCGGAAAAMVFRYWGEAHADVQQFAPLVDRARGGIEADRLVVAIRSKGWSAEAQEGSLAQLRAQLADGVPPILLIEDRPARGGRPAQYHFVVAVGIDDTTATIHDPTWGPARRIPVARLQEAWKAAGFWSLIVRRTKPHSDVTDSSNVAAPALASVGLDAPPTRCDLAMDEAIATVATAGLDTAERLFAETRPLCAGSSRPVSELAGVRFAQGQYAAAAHLASQALTVNRRDAYAWDVLASSRFMQNDTVAALKAWNAVARPQLDSVRIEGLTETRYSLVAGLMPLEPNELLTPDVYRLAARRLEMLPTFTSTALRMTPQEEGWASVTAAVVERQPRPAGRATWLGIAGRAVIDREVVADLPGWSGQGEVWSVGWRWWTNRPKVAVSFATPAGGRVPGVWKVDASWSAQEFVIGAAKPLRQEQRHGGIELSNWMTPNLRYTAQASVDAWDGTRKAAGVGGRLERRFLADRLSLAGIAHLWWPLAVADRFTVGEVRLAARSAVEHQGFVTLASAGTTIASAAAPLSLWPGAGDVSIDSPLLRAHPLTDDGRIDSPAFGRQLSFASVEQRRWLGRAPLIPMAIAGFLDMARAWRPADPAAVGPWIVDAGVGLRVRLPGRADVVRIDYGRGLRDGAYAISIGWQR